MIDLHSHVLPAIDDGAPSVEEAVALARAAAARGTRVLAATPHCRADHPGVRPPELRTRCDDLAGALETAGVALEVVPGGEVDLDWARAAGDDDLRLVSYGQRGTDLLVETPYGELPFDFEHQLGSLAGRGFRLLLAHPERSPTLRSDPARIEALVERGVLIQVTARAVAGDPHGRDAHALAVRLVERDLVHVLASDAHAAEGPAPPDVADGVAAARKLIGERADWMATAAPAAILAGEALPRRP